MVTMKIRTYSELILLPTFEERFKYLQVKANIGIETFGHSRYLNQKFYKSREWRSIRDFVIVRDNGCDLGVEDHPIGGQIYIHHMNPITVTDISDATEYLMDPEFLICVSQITHNAIHYGDERLLPQAPIERKPNDTCPWRKQ